MSKRVPTLAPSATKDSFFAPQWVPLTPGPLPLEGMSGFPRWHTEAAIRGRKPGQGHGRGARAMGAKQAFVFRYTHTPEKDTFIQSHKRTTLTHTHTHTHIYLLYTEEEKGGKRRWTH